MNYLKDVALIDNNGTEIQFTILTVLNLKLKKDFLPLNIIITGIWNACKRSAIR